MPSTVVRQAVAGGRPHRLLPLQVCCCPIPENTVGTMTSLIRLGVNIDHVATLRQARGTAYPDPLAAAFVAADAGADGITMHLREDRRHIQDRDVERVREHVLCRLNFEMAATVEMIGIAERLRPDDCCLVPERREEITTEGGLDVAGNERELGRACERLAAANIRTSLFIDPEEEQIEAARRVGSPAIELHTGAYANAAGETARAEELAKLERAAEAGHRAGLIINAGHGLHYQNVQPVAAVAHMHELNIGHAIVARAVLYGLHEAVSTMKALMREAAALRR